MSISINPIKKALISVWNKEGLEKICPLLKQLGTEVYSTQGTGEFLKTQFGISVTPIDSVTQFPEMLGGRVKTLHPRIFGGVLARREQPSDMEEAKKFEIPLFDLVVVNLYPFWEHLGENPYDQSSFIDIGGPSLIRSASKNSRSVAVLSDPADYSEWTEEAQRLGGTTCELRHKLAARAFQRTSAYDAMIAKEWAPKDAFPTQVSLHPQTSLRYGENPHQTAFWSHSGDKHWNCLQGKELSYNNLLDTDAALRIVNEFSTTAVSIIKHNNPCGVAAGKGSVVETFQAALQGDSKSAFGGVVATNRIVDAAAAEAMSSLFLEVILAPGFDSAAKEVLAAKKNLRLIEWPSPSVQPFDVRAALGGWLVQSADTRGIPTKFEQITTTKVHDEELKTDLLFSWLVCKHVRSNAIVIAKSGRTLGIGAGQMSRVDAVHIALQKASSFTGGAVLASDAFFPFRDNIDLLKGKGIRAIIQPGGSQRDGEVIQACNELGIAMVFTGERHFRH
jgi:phosphoribosylaminoimidazolecarboxamide formyltransferase / IMP cyclohydrolase